MRYQYICFILLCLLFLTGCLQSRQLEKMGVITAKGTDASENGDIELSIVLFQFEAQSTNNTKIVSGKGKTIQGATQNANYETNFELSSEKLQLELFGREAAERGIHRFVDTLAREANSPNTMYLSLSNSTAKEIMLIQESGIAMNIGQYLHGVIDKNAPDHLFPKIPLSTFLTSLYDVGIDPILPMFELENGIPKITKIGIFKEDKLVGEKSIEDRILYNLMHKKIKQETLVVTLPFSSFQKDVHRKITQNEENLSTSFNILSGSSKTRLKDKKDLSFQTNIKLELELNETSHELNFKDEQVIRKLEQAVEKKLASKYKSILADLQQLNADSFGYGKTYRIHQKGKKLTKKEWHKLYPKIKVDFSVDANIIYHGEID
ncbi:Ger(x)C family spore germination protein [Virgibacillus sp. LDC-1]|uniref:Ger(x)C family spore germination protein n=1 Tax=Virgibacillus sp. LDC-1 TaxID=3039856 RepID=UPI0024DEA297|nr:Ger(x)C family spore germination protein [Virgibacillus sp. LDC-1]